MYVFIYIHMYVYRFSLWMLDWLQAKVNSTEFEQSLRPGLTEGPPALEGAESDIELR